MAEEIICCGCGKDATNQHYMCDLVDGEWCPECFEKTDCGQGKHGEGCPTTVFAMAAGIHEGEGK